MGILNNLKSIINKQPPQVTTPQPEPAPPQKTILIVEDEKDLRDFYSELLTNNGFSILTAENGQAGFDTIISNRPDLVLLDLMMPVMDGKTMLHKVRAIPEFIKLPVIVLTNAGDDNSMRETKLFDNANEFLIKANITPDEIIQKVKMLTT